MRPFRFRAAAALVMRRKQEDTARQQLAAAETTRKRAEDQAQSAAQAVARAGDAAADACRSGAEGWRRDWHQSWIARKRLEADAGRRAAAISAEAAGRATAAVQLAYQRRRALERLRDRAWHRHKLEASRHELQAMNELATLRHHARPDDEQ
jgi:flagellar biosynthesis chaperone FliJ